MSFGNWFIYWLGGWKNSLKFKIGNDRSKMRNLGHPDVTINGGRRGMNNPKGMPSKKRIKKRNVKLTFCQTFRKDIMITALNRFVKKFKMK